MSEREDPPSGDDQDPKALLLGAGCTYTLLLFGALLWLALRDRLQALPQVAIGEHGLFASAVAGLAVGLAGHGLLGIVARRSPAVRELEERTGQLLVGMSEAGGFAFVLITALIEELFFRLAVQDALGLIGSVAAYVLLSISAGRTVVLLAATHALCLGALVQFGFGLYASTTAHAVTNYLSLRRIACR